MCNQESLKWKYSVVIGTKSLYRSRAGSHFHEKDFLGRLAILKKNWANHERLLRMFSGAKKYLRFTKKLHDISFISFFFSFFLAKNRLNIHNPLCIGDISLRDFCIMTLDLYVGFGVSRLSVIQQFRKQ